MPLAIVTGANRGIGLQVSKDLVQLGYEVIVASRDARAGEQAAQEELGGEPRARSIQLDVSDASSVAAFVEALREGARVDALVNNAGTSFDGFDAEVARRTLDTNYRGPVRLTRALLPRLSESANVVMVSSGMGELSSFGPALREKLLAPTLSADDVERTARDFEQAVAAGRQKALGFPSNAYAVSKALLNAFTRVLGKEFAGTRHRVNAVCPGWVRTRMGGSSAPRSLEQGARGIVWAATLPDGGPNGQFFRDGKSIAW
ncbi:MAG TPA: SDR family NAD(P)-dependent oxidoreductase [Polyangiaceae bacterium]|nr:SDR family NAD(P)-dependent oxidoreductase [Polyangiaceae bacterium]